MKDYKYLFTLKVNRESEEKIIEILKGKKNVKEYLIRAILKFEEEEGNNKGKDLFQSNVISSLKRIENRLEQINRNTEI